MVTTPRDASGPPRWLALLTWAALAALLYYPVHFPYQHPDALVADFERFAVLLADFPVVARPGTRVYEPDMNYAPMRGMTTLARPGPRLRIWYVPPPPGRDAPSPFVDGYRP